MKRNEWGIAILIIAVSWVSFAVCQDDMSGWRAQLEDKGQQIRKIELQIAAAQERRQRAIAEFL
jgi:hypothetical protein